VRFSENLLVIFGWWFSVSIRNILKYRFIYKD